MNYYKQGDSANADKIKAAFEKLGIGIGGYDFRSKDALYFTYKVKGETYMMSTLVDTGLDHIIKTHPDYNELELPVEPKFKVGDWIVQNDNGTVSQITKTINGKDEYGEYLAYEHTNGYFAACFENEYHLWTIADAKDGDVLVAHEVIGLFKEIDGLNIRCHFSYHYMNTPMVFTNALHNKMAFRPATKDERELLFAKMKEAGYQWDVEKKELRKIQPHYDIANFKPFDKVLVRDNDRGKWRPSIFSYHIKGRQTCYPFCCIGNSFSQCIPFEGNEKLLGTTDMPSEEYINW